MTQIYADCASAIIYRVMSMAGVIKATASFYRVDSDTAFERHQSRIPINCGELETVQSLRKHLLSFLGLRELAMKFGLGNLI